MPTTTTSRVRRYLDDLDRALRDLDGAQVTSSTVAPHDATVLRGTGAVVRAG